MEVAVKADELADRAGRRETVEHLPDGLTAARDRGDRLVVGELVEDLFDLVVDRRGQQPESLGARDLGCEGRVVPVAREGAVHRADHLPRPSSVARNEPGAVASSERPSSHPSRASGRKRCAMPSVAVIGAPE